ncbi:MAG TPA: hypothetical protein VFP09_04465 [Desertimonas sp.]|nr:hypothetical protein [Desertimonas sp.]
MATTVLLENFNSIYEWTLLSGEAPTQVAGRTGLSLKHVSGTYIGYKIPAAAESDTLTVGFAYRADALSTNSLANFSSDTGATNHVTLTPTALGAIQVRRGTGSGTILVTSANGVISGGASSPWYYIELQAKLHDTTGFATLRVNGVPVASFPTGDTKNAGTKTTFDQFGLLNVGYFDDCYIITGTDGAFLGAQAIPDGLSTDVVARHATVVAVKRDPYHVARHATQVAVKRDTYHVARHALQVAMQYQAKRWTGTGFVPAPAIRTWTGTAFVEAKGAKRWNGTAFV